MKSIKKILVTTDFSSDSGFAVEEAAMMARKFHSKLYLLDVVGRVSEGYGDYVLPLEVVKEEKERLMKEARRRLQKIVAEVESRYQIKAVADVRYGDVFNEIMKEEEEEGIDLVVIAPHSGKRVMPGFFRRLSERVAKKSCCDTLLVRQG